MCIRDSYRGAQIFEALGLRSKFVNKYFNNTPSRIEGIGLYVLEKEISTRIKKAFGSKNNFIDIEIGGEYKWRRNGEAHMLNPLTISKLQQAVKEESYETYKVYSENINKQNEQFMTLRGMFKFSEFDPIPIEEVEPWTEIVKRFKTGAMSYGSLSKEAHENLAIAMNRIGGKSNSGEGGEDPIRFKTSDNGDSKNSSIKQVASGRFGVSSHFLTNASEIQIKMAQGAKPGEGGQLPGPKVNPMIAKVRNSTPYVGLISPPPHHDIYSIEDLAQLIYDLKNANRSARINVKLVSEVGVGTIAAGVAKAYADLITISGHDGGTGASPLTSIRYAGSPWELGLSEAHQSLRDAGLRHKIRLQTDGGMKTGLDVIKAAILGAESFGFGTGPMISMGCKYLRICHLNNCATGVATQRKDLINQHFIGEKEKVINYFQFIANDVRQHLKNMGVSKLEDLIGQTQYLKMTDQIEEQYKNIDLSGLLEKDEINKEPHFCTVEKNEPWDQGILAKKILKQSKKLIDGKKKGTLNFRITNMDRSIGASISGYIATKYGEEGLPKPLSLKFKGSAGQSFGCWNANNLNLILDGDANDYVGKGLNGGRIVIKNDSDYAYGKNTVLAGNTCSVSYTHLTLPTKA